MIARRVAFQNINSITRYKLMLKKEALSLFSYAIQD